MYLFWNLFSFVDEGQSVRVQAEAQSGRWGTIVKNVTKVCFTPRAKYFGSVHAKAVVGSEDQIFLRNRLKETWPARTRIELRVRSKKRQIAADAMVDADTVVIEQSAAIGWFGSMATDDFILCSS